MVPLITLANELGHSLLLANYKIDSMNICMQHMLASAFYGTHSFECFDLIGADLGVICTLIPVFHADFAGTGSANTSSSSFLSHSLGSSDTRPSVIGRSEMRPRGDGQDGDNSASSGYAACLHYSYLHLCVAVVTPVMHQKLSS